MQGRKTCLDMFCGLGGFSAAFADAPRWDTVTVDIKERFDPDIQADVMDLRPKNLPDADVVLASPPCRCFSIANQIGKQNHWKDDGAPESTDAKESVALVYHTIGVIKGLGPDYWFLENPRGHLRRILGRPTGEVTYCQYGTRYMKPTDLWGEHPPMTYRHCQKGATCHERSTLERGRDTRPLPRDPAERAKVPYELSNAILQAVEGRGEQSTLPTQQEATD